MEKVTPFSRPLHGFTLVELLVVIGIIGLLAAIITPVVMQSLTKARNAAIKAEIDMLHMALMNYQSEYGVLPPCEEPVVFMDAAGNYTKGGPSAKHLKRLFPRCADAAYQLNNVNNPDPPVRVTSTNAIFAWLSGFTTSPTSPLVPRSSRVKLFGFDKARIDGSSGGYFPSGKRNSPYIYIDSASYELMPYLGGNAAGAMRETYAGDATPFKNESPETNDWFNPGSFQILCAGRDEVFGTDDDLSNFWPGTRREYLDGLKD